MANGPSQNLRDVTRESALDSRQRVEIRYPASSRDHEREVYKDKLGILNAKGNKVFGADKWNPVKIEWFKD